MLISHRHHIRPQAAAPPTPATASPSATSPSSSSTAPSLARPTPATAPSPDPPCRRAWISVVDGDRLPQWAGEVDDRQFGLHECRWVAYDLGDTTTAGVLGV